MSIYSTNTLSVGLSVRLQKAKELRYLWMLSSLFLNNHADYHLVEMFMLNKKKYAKYSLKLYITNNKIIPFSVSTLLHFRSWQVLWNFAQKCHIFSLSFTRAKELWFSLLYGYNFYKMYKDLPTSWRLQSVMSRAWPLWIGFLSWKAKMASAPISRNLALNSLGVNLNRYQSYT